MPASFLYLLYYVSISLHLEWNQVLDIVVRDTHENGPVDHVEGEEEEGEDNPGIPFNVTCPQSKQGCWKVTKLHSRYGISIFNLIKLSQLTIEIQIHENLQQSLFSLFCIPFLLFILNSDQLHLPLPPLLQLGLHLLHLA